MHYTHNYRGWVRLNSLNWSLSNRQMCPVRITAESESSFLITVLCWGLFVNLKTDGRDSIYLYSNLCFHSNMLHIWYPFIFDYFVSVAWKSLQRGIFLATDKSGRDWYWLVVTLFLLAYYQLLSVKTGLH